MSDRKVKLLVKDVEVKGVKYQVKEITVGAMLPILPMLQEGGETAQDAQMDMLKQCILIDGEPIGDDVTELSMAAYMKLSTEVMEINGLEVKGEGKDSPDTSKPSTQ